MGPARKTRSSAKAAAAQFNNNDKPVTNSRSKRGRPAKQQKVVVEESDDDDLEQAQPPPLVKDTTTEYDSEEDIPLAARQQERNSSKENNSSVITPLKIPTPKLDQDLHRDPHQRGAPNLPVAPGTPGTPGTPGPNPVPQTPTIAPPQGKNMNTIVICQLSYMCSLAQSGNSIFFFCHSCTRRKIKIESSKDLSKAFTSTKSMSFKPCMQF